MIHLKPEHYLGAIKIFVILTLFFYIRKLNIPDNYKFLLTVLPSILILSTTKMIDHFKFKGKNSPIVVNKDDLISDKYLPEEFYFEPFTIETPQNSNAMIYEMDKPFWIEDEGYLDISNPKNFIKIDNLKLNTNYTIEFWVRLKYVSNNAIFSCFKHDKTIFNIYYDNAFLVINDINKIPYRENEWFHVVIMRGKLDTLGTTRGSLYINGIFYSYIDNIPDLTEMNDSYLFKYSNTSYLTFNRNYHDLSNCSIFRIYDRSLSIDEIQNNYLKDANYFGLEDEDITGKTYVQDSSLIFYLEARKDHYKPQKVKKIKRKNKNKKDLGSSDSDWLVTANKNNEKEKEKEKVVIINKYLEVPLVQPQLNYANNDWLEQPLSIPQDKQKVIKKEPPIPIPTPTPTIIKTTKPVL